MLTTLAVKIVVKTVTKVSTVMKFELSEVQTLSKANWKCQGANWHLPNLISLFPQSTGLLPCTLHFQEHRKCFKHRITWSRWRAEYANDSSPPFNLRRQNSVLPAFLLLISNFIQLPLPSSSLRSVHTTFKQIREQKSSPSFACS